MKVTNFILSALLVIIIGCKTKAPENWKEKADADFEKKDYTTAIKYLEDWVSNEPNNQELHYYLGQAYRQLLFEDGGKINDLDIAKAYKPSEHFRKVIEISPKYEGRKFVVGPYTKIQSIWGSMGITYLYRGEKDSAIWAFQKGQSEGAFYPSILEYNKNIMASCDKDAIIFTNGDNDTYPMWFAQLVENYRNDITVVNVSLLNVSWYINQLKNGYPFGYNNIAMNLSDDEIDNLAPKQWTSTDMQLPVTRDPLNKKGKIEWTMNPTVEDKIIRVQDLMIVEILKANNWKRPVYFSTTVYKPNKIGLDEYLSLEGLVYRLKSHEEKISIDRLKNNCLNVYTYDGTQDKHLQYIEEMQSLFQNYRACYIGLADHYLNSDKKSEAQKMIQLMETKFPENLLPYTHEQLKKEVDDLKLKAQG